MLDALAGSQSLDLVMEFLEFADFAHLFAFQVIGRVIIVLRSGSPFGSKNPELFSANPINVGNLASVYLARCGVDAGPALGIHEDHVTVYPQDEAYETFLGGDIPQLAADLTNRLAFQPGGTANHLPHLAGGTNKVVDSVQVPHKVITPQHLRYS